MTSVCTAPVATCVPGCTRGPGCSRASLGCPCMCPGVHGDGKPSRMMADAMIYQLVAQRFVSSERYEEAYVSSRGLVRIVRVLDVSATSKAWAAEVSNHACDAPGSWYCPGAYPPELAALLDPTSQAA